MERYDSTKEEDRVKGVAVGAVEKKKERGDRDGMDIGRGRIRWRIIVRIVGVWWRERECEARSWRGCESQFSLYHLKKNEKIPDPVLQRSKLT